MTQPIIRAQFVMPTEDVARSTAFLKQLLGSKVQDSIKEGEKLLAVTFQQKKAADAPITWETILVAKDGTWQQRSAQTTSDISLKIFGSDKLANVSTGNTLKKIFEFLFVRPERFRTAGSTAFNLNFETLNPKTDTKSIYEYMTNLNKNILDTEDAPTGTIFFNITEAFAMVRGSTLTPKKPSSSTDVVKTPPKPSRPPPPVPSKTSTKTPTAEETKPASPALILKNHNRLEDILLGTWFFLFSSLSIYCFYMARNSD